MFWLISYGAPEGVPQDIGPGYSVEDLTGVAGKEGTPRDTLKDPTVPKGTVLYEPNGGSLRETARNPGRISGLPLGP